MIVRIAKTYGVKLAFTEEEKKQLRPGLSTRAELRHQADVG
jgi:hypothetical protein